MWNKIKKYGFIIGAGIGGILVFAARVFAGSGRRQRDIAGRIRDNHRQAIGQNTAARGKLGRARSANTEALEIVDAEQAGIERDRSIINDAKKDTGHAKTIIQRLRALGKKREH